MIEATKDSDLFPRQAAVQGLWEISTGMSAQYNLNDWKAWEQEEQRQEDLRKLKEEKMRKKMEKKQKKNNKKNKIKEADL